MSWTKQPPITDGWDEQGPKQEAWAEPPVLLYGGNYFVPQYFDPDNTGTNVDYFKGTQWDDGNPSDPNWGKQPPVTVVWS